MRASADVHSNLEDLRQYSLGRLAVSDVAAIEVHLRECQACRNSLAEMSVGPFQRAVERRSEVRLNVDIPARVKGLDPVTSIGPSTSGKVLDISNKGLKLRVTRPFLPGSIVQVRFQDRIVLGKVKYCNCSENEFNLGVLFREEL